MNDNPQLLYDDQSFIREKQVSKLKFLLKGYICSLLNI